MVIKHKYAKIPTGFLPKMVWIMGYCGFMGYGMTFSANQLGGLKKLWGIREYGLSERLWDKRESTVATDVCNRLPHELTEVKLMCQMLC